MKKFRLVFLSLVMFAISLSFMGCSSTPPRVYCQKAAPQFQDMSQYPAIPQENKQLGNPMTGPKTKEPMPIPVKELVPVSIANNLSYLNLKATGLINGQEVYHATIIKKQEWADSWMIARGTTLVIKFVAVDPSNGRSMAEGDALVPVGKENEIFVSVDGEPMGREITFRASEIPPKGASPRLP